MTAIFTRLPGRCHRLFGRCLAGPSKLVARLSDDSGAGHVALGCALHERLVGVAGYEGVRRFVADVLAENPVGSIDLDLPAQRRQRSQ